MEICRRGRTHPPVARAARPSPLRGHIELPAVGVKFNAAGFKSFGAICGRKVGSGFPPALQPDFLDQITLLQTHCDLEVEVRLSEVVRSLDDGSTCGLHGSSLAGIAWDGPRAWFDL
jgi:hypothetical protein